MTTTHTDKQTDRPATPEKHTRAGTTSSPGDKALSENSQENLDRKLDQAIEESFPGSDPVSVKITK